MDPRHNSSQRNQEPGTLTSGRQVVDIGLNYSTLSSFGGNGNIMSSSPLKEQSPEDSLSQVNKTFNMDRTAMDIPSSFYYNSPITEGYQTFSNKSPVSSKNSSGLFCRICHDGDSDDNRLISPCSCSGSVGLIHRACIEKWLTTVNQDTCEICQQKFMVSKHSKPFTKWLLTPAVGDDQRNLLGDSVCFLLLTPLTTISAYLCASGAMFYLRQVKKSEAVGLMCLASLLIVIYLIWLLLTIRYHIQVWFKWRVNNQDIRLLDVSANRPRINHQKYSILENNYDVKARDEVARDQDSDDEESKEIIDEYDKIEIFVIDASKDGSTVGVDTDTPTTRDNIDGQADNPISQDNLALINELKNFSNIPLSPHVISTDQCEAPSPVIVSSTPDSDIYAPIQRSIDQDASRYTTPQMSLPFPYVSELKERVGHMITIGSSPQSNERKSRGTFSPMPRRSIPKRPCL